MIDGVMLCAYFVSSSLASGIVSTAFQCGMKICPTVDVLLKSPVIIKIQHSEELQSNLTSDDALTTKCVFWEFQQIERYIRRCS